MCTYHPQHLFNNKQDKRSAYEDLLNFKKKLHNYDNIS